MEIEFHIFISSQMKLNQLVGFNFIWEDEKAKVVLFVFFESVEWTGREVERGDDIQQRAAGRTRTGGRCRELIASIYGARAAPTEPPGGPRRPKLF